MSRKLIAIAMLTALIGSAAPALAASNLPGAVSILLPVVVRPSIRPRVHIPSISRHVATQLQTGQTGDNAAAVGGLTTTGQGVNAAMLLPAVQAAREAARRSSSNAGKGKGKVRYYQYELKNVYVSSY